MKKEKSPEEWFEIINKVHRTGKMANTLAKALAKRYAYRWQFVDFRGSGGEESAGVVDIIAIRKSGIKPDIDGLKSLDLFDIILIQVKGGSAAQPKADDVNRLKLVKAHYHAHAIVLFEWNKKKQITRFSELDDCDVWAETTAAKLFGKRGKSKAAEPINGTAKKLPRVTDLPSIVALTNPKSNAAKKAWVTRKAAQSVTSKQ